MSCHDPARIRGLILPVGISPEPVLFTIRELKPDFLGLIATRASEATMDAVFQECPFPPHRSRVAPIDDSPEKIGELVHKVYDLYHWMRFDQGLEAQEVAIDPTPGRKWMSAGATMVASYLGLMMVYVDVQFAEGRPQPDTMRLVRLGNAFDQTGFLQGDRARVMFNDGHFAAAGNFFHQIRPTRAQEADYFSGLEQLATVLHRWDLFEHYEESLRDAFDMAMVRLERFSNSVPISPEFRRFIERVRELAAAVETVSSAAKPNLFAVADLLRNAERRMGQGHYDDAVGRLYRAFEAIAQYYLLHDFQLDVSDPSWSNRDQRLQEAAQRACGHLPDKIACVHAWSVLRELGHPAAEHVFVRGKQGRWSMKLEGLLNDRNNSILAHGWRPISQTRAENMHDRLVQLLRGTAPPEVLEVYRHLEVPLLPSTRSAGEERSS